MILPEKYREVRSSLGFDEIDFGVGGILLFDVSEIEGGQRGYSVAPDGKPLCSGGEGTWRRNWIVIGF